MATERNGWEAWELTAYVLGELQPDRAAQIEAASVADPELAGEIASLAMTVRSVRESLSRETLTAADRSAIANLHVPQTTEAEMAVSAMPSDEAALQRVTGVQIKSRRRLWTSIALAASALLLIGVYAADRKKQEAQQVALNPSGKAPLVIRERTSSLAEGKNDWSESSSIASPAENQVAQSLDVAASSSGIVAAPNVAENELGNRIDRENKAVELKPLSDGTIETMEGLTAKLSTSSVTAPQTRLPQQATTNSPVPRSVSGPVLTNPAPLDQKGMLGDLMKGSGRITSGPTSSTLVADDARVAPTVTGLEKDSVDGMAAYRWHVEGKRPAEILKQEQRARQFGYNRDQFEPIVENAFVKVADEPLSTFSIDVDTASYTKTRQFLMQGGCLPPAAAVRVEEFINYFDYEYAGPQDDKPFSAELAVAECPWKPEHQLVRIALQARKIDMAARPQANIVFLLDVSGSMDEPNKLPLVKEAMRLLTYQLSGKDRVAIVVYAGAAGCVLESTSGDKQGEILGAIERLSAGGSTNGGQGIELAYRLAREHFIPGGINRVVLCTDGDFNVGVTSTDELVKLVVEQAKSKVFLTVLGFGAGNTNDAMMEQISNRGNGLYAFVDSKREAQRQMVQQLVGNLMTVAKDVKLQVEFNPAKVRSYRLVGYENRRLANEDFNNDKKDAGEIGAGHRVTALYEVEPVGVRKYSDSASVDPLRYQAPKAELKEPEVRVQELPDASSKELLAVKLRYKEPEGDESKLLTFPLEDQQQAFSDADRDFRWAASVAEFAMLLRRSEHKGNATWSTLEELAKSAAGVSPEPARAECLKLIEIARSLEASPLP